MTQYTEIHDYTVVLAPTPAQRAELQQLSWLAGLTRTLAQDQARLRADEGQDVSIAAMLDATQDHTDRTPGAEARALQHVSETRGAPQGLLVDAILAGRADRAARRTPRRIDFPHDDVYGVGLANPTSAGGVTIAGVTGEILFDPSHLPRWAAQVWAQAAGAALTLPAVNVTGAGLIDYVHIARVDEGFEYWTMNIVLGWNDHRAWELLQRMPHEKHRILAPREVAELMGW